MCTQTVDRTVDPSGHSGYILATGHRRELKIERTRAMKRNLILWAALLVGVGVGLPYAQAENKYNPYTRQWEAVSPDSTLQLNPVTGKWELAPPNSAAKLNPYTGKYEMVPPNAVARYNPYTKQWELAPPNARLEFDRGSNAWHYTR